MKMNLLIAVLSIIFLVMGCIGLRRYESDWWNFVDLVYYPMAAIGVVLLFINTSAQRQLFDLAQLERLHKDRIADLVQRQPKVSVSLSAGLVDSSFELVGTIEAFAKVCRYPGNVDPRCSAAEALHEPAKKFLEAAKSVAGQPVEDRLARACPEADQLILGTGDGKGMSSLVGQELVAQYKTSREKQLSFAEYEELERDAASFEKFARSKILTVQTILKNDPQTSRYAEGILSHEVEFGKLLLLGLMPCIVSDRKEIETLTDWKRTRQTEEELLTTLDADRKKISTTDVLFPWLARIQYFVWPYLIGIALSLKFGKGVATWKRHRSSARPVVMPMLPIPSAQDLRSEEGEQLATPTPNTDGEVHSPEDRI
jgi:hypothetical protein